MLFSSLHVGGDPPALFSRGASSPHPSQSLGVLSPDSLGLHRSIPLSPLSVATSAGGTWGVTLHRRCGPKGQAAPGRGEGAGDGSFGKGGGGGGAAPEDP